MNENINVNKKWRIGWKHLSKLKGEEIVQINFQAPEYMRDKFNEACKKIVNTNIEIEFLKLMDKFIKKHSK